MLCNDADLQFDFVEQFHNAQLHYCLPHPPKKNSEHICHMWVNMSYLFWCEDSLLIHWRIVAWSQYP